MSEELSEKGMSKPGERVGGGGGGERERESGREIKRDRHI